jgi:hypothetical protein
MTLTPGQYDRLQQWIVNLLVCMGAFLILAPILAPLFLRSNAVSGTCNLECKDSVTAGEVNCVVRGRN